MCRLDLLAGKVRHSRLFPKHTAEKRILHDALTDIDRHKYAAKCVSGWRFPRTTDERKVLQTQFCLGNVGKDRECPRHTVEDFLMI